MAKQTRRTPAKKAAAKKAAAKKAGPAKKAAARKTTGRKAPARKPAKRASSSSMMPGWFNDAISSTHGREALAAALIAGAAAAAAVLAKRGAGGKIKSAVSEASNATRDFADAAADAFVEVTSDAVRNFLPSSASDSDDRDQPGKAGRGGRPY